MEIKKGKYYLIKEDGKLRIADRNMHHDGIIVTDKIAVHTPTQEDWDYVCEKLGYVFANGKYNSYNEESCIELNNEAYTEKRWYKNNYYHIITMQQFKSLFEPQSEVYNPQNHYDNTHGSLYLIAQQRGWDAYQFDIIKRIDRAKKKGVFKEDLQKTKDLIDLYLQEKEG